MRIETEKTDNIETNNGLFKVPDKAIIKLLNTEIGQLKSYIDELEFNLKDYEYLKTIIKNNDENAKKKFINDNNIKSYIQRLNNQSNNIVKLKTDYNNLMQKCILLQQELNKLKYPIQSNDYLHNQI